MVSVRPLHEAERRDLRRRARTEVGRGSERIRRVLLSGRRAGAPQVAALGECSKATVRGWLARFDAEGRGGWYDRLRAGRPRPPSYVAIDNGCTSFLNALHREERLTLRFSSGAQRRPLHRSLGGGAATRQPRGLLG